MKKEIKKVPAIRFKGFTDDWEQRKLSDIADVRDGTHDSPQYVDEGYPFITSKNVSNGYITYDDIHYISEKDFNEINKRSKVNAHDILMGMIGTIGNLALIREKTNFAIKNVALIKYTGCVNYNFLYQALQSPLVVNQLSGTLDGGTQKFISLGKIRKLSIPYSSEEEANKIGAYLENIDSLITLHQRKLKQLQALKKYFLQNMFPAKEEKVPAIRFKGFTDDWEQRKLGELLQDLYNGQTPSRFNKQFWGGNINWLTSGELNRGIVEQTLEKITEKGRKKAHLQIVPKGTFVIAITGLEAEGTRGNCAIVNINTALNQSCMALFPDENKLNISYLFQWYRLVGEKYGIQFTQGTKQQSYNADIIKKLKIVLPQIEEQKKIARWLQKIDNLITLHQRKCDQLQSLKKFMLQNLFIQRK